MTLITRLGLQHVASRTRVVPMRQLRLFLKYPLPSPH